MYISGTYYKKRKLYLIYLLTLPASFTIQSDSLFGSEIAKTYI